MTVWNVLQDFFAKPLSKLHNTLLMTGWAEMAAFTRKGQQIFMAAFPTFDSCEAVMEDAAVQVSIDDLLYVGPQKSILFGKTIIIDPFKFLEMIFNTPIILRILRFARSVNPAMGGIGHALVPLR